MDDGDGDAVTVDVGATLEAEGVRVPVRVFVQAELRVAEADSDPGALFVRVSVNVATKDRVAEPVRCFDRDRENVRWRTEGVIPNDDDWDRRMDSERPLLE